MSEATHFECASCEEYDLNCEAVARINAAAAEAGCEQPLLAAARDEGYARAIALLRDEARYTEWLSGLSQEVWLAKLGNAPFTAADYLEAAYGAWATREGE